jgi:hypothetical protein
LPGEDGDGLARGGAAHAFPVLGCIVVEPAFADAFWAAAALFAASLPSGAVESPPCFALQVAPQAGGRVRPLDTSFLGCVSRVLIVRMIPLALVYLVAQISWP